MKKRFLNSLSRAFCLMMIVLGIQPNAKAQLDLAHLPDYASPSVIGKKVADRFLAKPYLLFGTTIGYPEVCTWYGALNFATLTKDAALKNKLVARFEPFFNERANLVPAHDNVDHSVFGAIPLQLYQTEKKAKYLTMGINFADQQWLIPDTMKMNEEIKRYTNSGYSWQTRLWIDDMYMIIMLQVQAYRATQKKHYLNRAAKEMVFYLEELQKPNGLFFHASDVPFFWGRGNGWMAAGMTEILLSLPKKHPEYHQIMKGYQTMMASLLRYQSASGMWNQLIDDPTAWAESSGTGMFTYALITGVKKKWLTESVYEDAAVKGWIALIGNLNKDSDLMNVCIGTNKLNNKQYYLNRKRITGDLHGQAPVLWCAMALLKN